MTKGLFNKNYILMLLCGAIFYISSFMMNSVRGKYCVDMGQSKFVCGLVIAVFTLASFVTRPLWAYYTDKSGRRRIVILGLLLCLAASVIPVLNSDIIPLLISRFVFGGGYSAITTAAGTIICDVTAPQLIPKAISVYGVTNVLSQAVAPSVALRLYEKSFSAVCIPVCLMIILCVVFIVFVKYKEKDFVDPNNKFAVLEKTAIPAAVTIFFFAAAVASVYSYVPVMAEERGINNPSFFFILSALSLLRGRLLNTTLSAKFSLSKLFYAGGLMLAVGFVVLAFSYNLLFLCLSAVFYGFGGGIVHPIANTRAVKHCKPEDRGLATGTFMMSQDIGMTAGAVMWGVVSGAMDFMWVYLLSALLAVLMAAAYKFLLNKNRSSK